MKFKPEVLSAMALAGFFTAASYGMYGGSIRPGGSNAETLEAIATGVYTGTAAGGQAGAAAVRECRSCARKGEQ